MTLGSREQGRSGLLQRWGKWARGGWLAQGHPARWRRESHLVLAPKVCPVPSRHRIRLVFCPVIWESRRSAEPVQQPGQVLVQHRGVWHLKGQCPPWASSSCPVLSCWRVGVLAFHSLPPWLLQASQLPSAWNSYGSRKRSTAEELIKNGLVGFPNCLG